MTQKTNAVRDTFYFLLVILSVTAVFWIKEHVYILLNSCLLILFVAFIARKRRQVWPVLAMIAILMVVETIISFMLFEPLAYFLLFSLFDLFAAFLILNYHGEKRLLNFLRVKHPSPQVPQVYFIAFILALSSMFSFVLGTEVVFYKLDPSVFSEDGPFFYSISMSVKMCLKVLLDLSIASLILIPNNWEFLRKLENHLGS